MDGKALDQTAWMPRLIWAIGAPYVMLWENIKTPVSVSDITNMSIKPDLVYVPSDKLNCQRNYNLTPFVKAQTLITPQPLYYTIVGVHSINRIS